MHNALENLKPTYGAYSTELGAETDIADAIQTGEFVDMANYDLVIAYAQAFTVVATHTLTLQLYEATDSDGADSQTLAGNSDVFVSGNVTETDVLQAEARGQELSDGFTFVGARLTTDDADGNEIVDIILVQGRPRFAQNALP